MALTATVAEPTTIATGWTVEQWLTLPEEMRCELVEGQVVVSPSPSLDHQRAVRNLLRHFDDHARTHGAEAFVAPLGVALSATTALEPDVLYVADPSIYGPRIIEGAPDIVVEVSSPSGRRYDQVVKRELYERFGVGEFWFVDLDEQRIEVHGPGTDGRFEPPVRTGVGETTHSGVVADLAVPVDAVLPR